MLGSLLQKTRSEMRQLIRNRTSRRVSARYDTSDVVQESLIQVWQQQKGLTSPEEEPNRSLLGQVVKGHAAKLYRFHSAAKRSAHRDLGFETGDALVEHEATTVAVQREELLHLLQALDGLNQAEKQVVFRHFFDGESLSAISRELECSIDIVRGNLTRALNRLRRSLSSLA